MTGCMQLSSVLAHNIRKIAHNDVGPILDFNALLRASQALPLLDSLAINSTGHFSLVRHPISLENLPTKLRSLDLDFHSVLSLFNGFDFAVSTPCLTYLSLQSPSTETKPYRAFQLPQSLQVLNCLWMGIRLADIQNLPRSLLSLEVTHVSDQEESVQPDYDWPPSLTSLCLINESSSLNIEYLPRSVVTLNLARLSLLATTFPQRSQKLVFPWRVFFPHLQNLTLPLFPRTIYCLSSLLASIVAAGAKEICEAEDLISSQLPSAKRLYTPVFSTFRSLELPFVWRQQGTTQLLAQLQAVAPYIQEVDFKNFPTSLCYLKHAGRSSLSTTEDVAKHRDKLPSTLTHLDAGMVHGSVLPSTLKRLECDALVGSEDGDPTWTCGDGLPNLTALTVRTPFSLIKLPQTITYLNLPVSSTSDWDLIATGLISLRQLEITLKAPWHCSKPLAPIKSTVFDIFDLNSTDIKFDPSKPRLHEFFSSPSPLPSTISSLVLNGQATHASILPVLPRGLRSLYISAFAWSAETIPNSIPFPEGANLSHDDLIKSLPNRLHSVSLFNPLDTLPRANPECLRFVPKSLGYFCEHNCFLMDNIKDIDSIFPEHVSCVSTTAGDLRHKLTISS